MDSILKSLIKAKSKDICVEVYIQERSGILVGKVQNVSEKYLLLESISPQGMNDGFILISIDEIYCVDLDTNYSRKIYKLYNLKSQKHDLVPLTEDNNFIDLLRFSKENNLIMEFDYFNYEENLSDQGFVIDIDDLCVSFRTIDNFGKVNGSKILKLENIKRLYCDGYHVRDLKLLYDLDF